ncbi:MAG TPA: NADH-ubiquinone/plastoquinone oxidoreductase chain 6 [Desulfobulbus sp.]|nr:NADH-ubiquinone/plastoquinone oxidoreductase chain 6 [Desulfobulbus sp.]
MFTYLFFLYCAVMIVGTGLLAITMRNPVHAVLMVLILFFHMAGLYLILGAEFLAAVQIIVYAGAILVLYLFVLFLVSLRDEVKMDRFVTSAWLGRIISVGLAVSLIAMLPTFVLGTKGHWPMAEVIKATHTKALGMEMYTTYILPFEIAGLILLIAVIGGMVLAKHDPPTIIEKS